MKRQLGVDMQIDIEAAFAPKLWAFVAVVTSDGCALGVAVANERGYSPVPLTRYCVSDYNDAEAEADRLNAARGMSEDMVMRITMSSIALGMINGQKVRSVG